MAVNMIEVKSRIVDYVSRFGPCLPVQLSKQIHSNILFAGAVLSELVANQKIKISTAKVGGSPVYYVGGQENKLSMLYSHLHEKEKKAYDLLKENNVLYDRALEPWQRVALRDLKDFAFPIQYNNEIFWKWYLFPEQEAMKMIQESIKQDVLQENVKVEEVKPEIIQEKKIEVNSENELKPELVREIMQKAEILPESKEVQVKLQPEIEKEEIKPVKEIKPKVKRVKRVKKEPDEFYNLLKTYFDLKNIETINEEIIKKNKEFEITANIPSEIGQVKFLIYVRDKKKITDADLSLAHNKAQLKKLPLMFLSSGDLDKKAKEYIINNYLIFEKI